ncbi:hypothetical protein [Pseudoxanthomonas koreensis]|uniref:hypothetical protein n=1 Tax=Pseudoxanthomonas koreensis TaxID=266061 RepID=UPI0035A5845C
MESTGYRLGNQVVLVHGAHASALYDLFDGRIQRVSSGLGKVLEGVDGHADVPGKYDASVLESLLRRLAERGFLERCQGNGGQRYSFDSKVPRFPPLRTLSFEIGSGTTAEDFGRILNFIADASRRFSLGSFAFLVGGSCDPAGGLEAVVASGLRHARFSICELWCASEAVGRFKALRSRLPHPGRVFVSEACDPVHGTIGVDEGGVRSVWDWDAGLLPSAMVCRADYYHLLGMYAECYGCLHFDRDWNVFPDVSEMDFFIGRPGAGVGLDDLLRDERLLGYWKVGKDRRDKCRDCELRYACPNPLSRRSRPDRLGSAPANCSYDLERGRW